MNPPGTARLHINGKSVGFVRAESFADSWGFGQFDPSPGFAEFAPLFGKWSLLMHADSDQSRLSAAASEELRHVEQALDGLRAQLIFDEHREVFDLYQIHIDGPLIQWKIAQRQSLRRAV